MEVTIKEINGIKYAYGTNPRITVSERTIKNAIGNLANHVEFIRSIASTSAEDLAAYEQCRRKWKVPESVSESSYGWEALGQARTSPESKRKRYS